MVTINFAWSHYCDRRFLVFVVLAISLIDVSESMRNRTRNFRNNHNNNHHGPFSGNGHRHHLRGNGSDYGRNILFKYYNGLGEMIYQTNVRNIQTYQQSECEKRENFAIIVHGWKEDCDAKWVSLLVTKLKTARGGCVMCMDYGPYATDTFIRLVRHFDPITHILTTTLRQLEEIGFQMTNGYMFGFSFGGQVVTEAGRRIGFNRMALIDTCDMAGPGFDNRPQSDHRLAAQNVQCLHTSRDKGTRHYNCHQDWRLGNCGYSQDAAADPPFGSHGLCPYFYISAFDHDFYAVPQPNECTSRAPAQFWPDKFKMGYLENRKMEVYGELFALTSTTYPYNIYDENGDYTDPTNADVGKYDYGIYMEPNATISRPEALTFAQLK